MLAVIDFANLQEPENLATLVRILVLVLVVWPALFLFSRLVNRVLRPRMTPQGAMLLRRGITYLGSFVLALVLMRELGFKISAILGAAGVVGVAAGFAAQTSLSNLISGLFLIWEKPFQIGDLIKVGDTTGFVHSIDLLSVKMRTFDNQFIRIPNESLLKGQSTNITYFPIRRMDLNVGVAYKEDLEHVMKVLKEIAVANPVCLDEPEPLVVVTGFGDSSINFMLGMWFYKTDFLQLRNTLIPALKKRFDEEGIEIPFPHRTLYTGSVTDPLPIQLVTPPAAEQPASGD